MRLLPIALLIFLTAITAPRLSAQFKKGEQFLSGTLAAVHATSSDNRTTIINFSPSYTRFTTDRKAASLKLIFTLQSGQRAQGGLTLNVRNYTVGVGVSRQKIFPLGKEFYFSTEYGVNALYLHGEESYEGSGTLPAGTSTAGYDLNLNLRPEVGYRLTDRFLVGIGFNDLLLVGFQQASRNAGSGRSDKQTTLYLNSALANISLGQLGVRFGVRI